MGNGNLNVIFHLFTSVHGKSTFVFMPKLLLTYLFISFDFMCKYFNHWHTQWWDFFFGSMSYFMHFPVSYMGYLNPNCNMKSPISKDLRMSLLTLLLWLSWLRTRCSVYEDASLIPGLAQWGWQLQLGFDPWSRNFHMAQVPPPPKKKRKNEFIYFGCTHSMQKFPGQGSNLCHNRTTPGPHNRTTPGPQPAVPQGTLRMSLS